MMRNRATHTEFEERLVELEEEVSAPLVPGELRPWLRSLRDLFGPLEGAWEKNLRAHQEVYDQILDTDVELASRVEQLEETQKKLGRKFEALRDEVLELMAQDAEHPEGSSEALDSGSRLRKKFLTWIVRARALEQEIDTWFVESLNRDVGAND